MRFAAPIFAGLAGNVSLIFLMRTLRGALHSTYKLVRAVQVFRAEVERKSPIIRRFMSPSSPRLCPERAAKKTGTFSPLPMRSGRKAGRTADFRILARAAAK